jgi:hypothetical protein
LYALQLTNEEREERANRWGGVAGNLAMIAAAPRIFGATNSGAGILRYGIVSAESIDAGISEGLSATLEDLEPRITKAASPSLADQRVGVVTHLEDFRNGVPTFLRRVRIYDTSREGLWWAIPLGNL